MSEAINIEEQVLMTRAIKDIDSAQKIELDVNYALQFANLLRIADAKIAKEHDTYTTQMSFDEDMGYITDIDFHFFDDHFCIVGGSTEYSYKSFPTIAFDVFCDQNSYSKAERIHLSELLTELAE